MARKKPDPPCVVCNGRGTVDCLCCRGRGRTNCVHLAMLPKGECPKWCRDCGGNGLGLCSRCLGTGEYRYIMGFNFMKMDFNQNHEEEAPLVGYNSNSGPHTLLIDSLTKSYGTTTTKDKERILVWKPKTAHFNWWRCCKVCNSAYLHCHGRLYCIVVLSVSLARARELHLK